MSKPTKLTAQGAADLLIHHVGMFKTNMAHLRREWETGIYDDDQLSTQRALYQTELMRAVLEIETGLQLP